MSEIIDKPKYKKKCYICGKFFEVNNENQIRCKDCSRK